MKKFILQCIQDDLLEFRLPELNSIAKMYNFDIEYYSSTPDATRPYMIIGLKSEKEALLIGSRSLTVKSIWSYWCHAESWEMLHEENRKVKEFWPNSPEGTWKLTFITYGKTISIEEKKSRMISFNYMELPGMAKLIGAEIEIGILSEYFNPNDVKKDEEVELRKILLGTKLCEGQRSLIDAYDLKKRAYIGTTSMEAQVSFLMANQVLAGPGKFIYDPFAGTGSLLISCSALGALTFGADIDSKQLRGKETNVATNAEQYGLTERILDCAIFDMSQHPFRTGEIFDGIITDPPYGVRAGARRSGRKVTQKPYVHKPVPGTDGLYCHQMPNFHPPSTPWEMESVIHSLVTLSLYLLKPSGRLSFFLPTDSDTFKDLDIPKYEGLNLISISNQNFGKWTRRLVTMEKVAKGIPFEPIGERGIVWEGVEEGLEGLKLEEKKEGEAIEGVGVGEGEGEKPGHADFRTKYFARFNEGPKIKSSNSNSTASPKVNLDESS